MHKLFAAMVAALPLAGCGIANGMSGDVVRPSGGGGMRTFDAAGFTRVTLSGADDVEVRHGASYAVSAQGDSALLDRLEIRKDGETLEIGRKHGAWKWGGDGRAKIVVTLPRLTAAAIAGSGDMRVDRATGDFGGAVAGSGDLDIAHLAGGKAGLTIAGSGNIRVAGGRADMLSARIAGSGDIDAAKVSAERGHVAITGSGNVRARFTAEANVAITGSGNAELTGGARCRVSRIGSGIARCS